MIFDRINIVIDGTFPKLPISIGIIIFVSFFIRFTQIIFQKNQLDEYSSILLFSLSILFSYLFWFIFLSMHGWWRHFLPFSALCIFLLGDIIHLARNFSKGKLWFRYLILASLGMALFFYGVPSFLRQYNFLQTRYPPSLLVSQREFSHQVSNYYEQGYKIGVFGWWQAPEISFLAGGIKFSRFSSCPYNIRGTVIIYTELQEYLDPRGAAFVKTCLGQQLVESQDSMYFLYKAANRNNK